MSSHESVDLGRRALIGAGGALMLGVALWPLRASAQTKLRIGVIGSGHIGGTIGGLWVKRRPQVLFSSRHPEELKDLVAGLGELAQAGTVEQAIAFGDVLFIAVPYGALPQIGQDYGAALKGKIMLDACNAIARPRRGAIADEVEHDGIGVISQKYLPGTRLVRAFNTLSYIDLRQRSEPSRSEARDPDRRRRCRSGAGRGRAWCATLASIRSWSASLPTRAASSAAGRVTVSGDRRRTQAETVADAMKVAALRRVSPGRCRRRRRSARRRCGRSAISSHFSLGITCCGRCATRWALPAA